MNIIPIEYWQALIALADFGTYRRAGEALHKTPSAIHLAVASLTERLGQTLVTVEGRSTVLTATAQALLPEAKRLVELATQTQRYASGLEDGVERRVDIAVEQIVERARVGEIAARFAARFPRSELHIHDFVLNELTDLLLAGRAAMAVGAYTPAGFESKIIGRQRLKLVVASHHPLASMAGLQRSDLLDYRQLVVRDPGVAPADGGWLSTGMRWTVGQLDTALTLCLAGVGYARLPPLVIAPHLESGALTTIDLQDRPDRQVAIHFIRGHHFRAGPASEGLAEIVLDVFGRQR